MTGLKVGMHEGTLAPVVIVVPDGGHHGGDGLRQLLPQGLQGGGEVGVLLVLLGDVDDTGLLLVLQILPAALRAHAEPVLGRVEIPIPEGKMGVVNELYDQLMEAVAETTEENMEKFFSGEPFTKGRDCRGTCRR